MAQSLTQVYIHLIFSTKNRTQYLTPEIQNRLHPYLVGIARSLESPAVKVGGHYDHIHILFSIYKNKTLSEIIGKLKGESSRWLNKEAITSSHFAWQARKIAKMTFESALTKSLNCSCTVRAILGLIEAYGNKGHKYI